MKAKIVDFETNSKKKISVTCIETPVILRRVTSLELI